jgi:hypothetical protein
MFSQGVTVILGLCYVVCTLLQIAGFATPAWVVSDYNGEIYESNGLWYSISCRNGGECEAKTYQQIHNEYKTAAGGMYILFICISFYIDSVAFVLGFNCTFAVYFHVLIVLLKNKNPAPKLQ